MNTKAVVRSSPPVLLVCAARKAHYIGRMENLPLMDKSENPLLADWTASFGAPPLERIKPEHFPPGFDGALIAHRAEIAAIAGDTAAPTFQNMVAALER